MALTLAGARGAAVSRHPITAEIRQPAMGDANAARERKRDMLPSNWLRVSSTFNLAPTRATPRLRLGTHIRAVLEVGHLHEVVELDVERIGVNGADRTPRTQRVQRVELEGER